jgi:acetamidase/formamidase
VGLDIPATIPPEKPAGVWPDVRQHLYRTGTYRGKQSPSSTTTSRSRCSRSWVVMGVAPATGAFVGSTPTAPPPASGVQGSGPPGPYGGNMDTHDLTVGSTLYLPVFQKGAHVLRRRFALAAG